MILQCVCVCVRVYWKAYEAKIRQGCHPDSYGFGPNQDLKDRFCLTPKKEIKESSPQCRQSIIDHVAWCADVLSDHYECPCIFGDMRQVLAPGTFQEGATFRQKYAAASRADIMDSQWCYTHRKLCPVYGPEAEVDIDATGLPCPDFSLAGLGMEEEGTSNEASLTFNLGQLRQILHLWQNP